MKQLLSVNDVLNNIKHIFKSENINVCKANKEKGIIFFDHVCSGSKFSLSGKIQIGGIYRDFVAVSLFFHNNNKPPSATADIIINVLINRSDTERRNVIIHPNSGTKIKTKAMDICGLIFDDLPDVSKSIIKYLDFFTSTV